VNIDMAALHAIEADKGISVDVVVDTIKSALLTAYRHTEGHEADARIEIDRKTGLVKVMARETDEDGNLISEWDDTPEGFGRIAATTARQVILQRLRDAENEKNYGEFSAREGDIAAGVIQRDARANARGLVVVRMGSETKGSEGVIPAAEQVPGERYEHGDRLRCYVVGVTRGAREPLITCRVPTPTWCASCSRWRFPRSPTDPSRSSRWRGKPATVPRSPSPRGCRASTPRAPASGRWASGCET